MLAAVISVPLSKRLGLGSVLGYLIAGSIIGPWGLRLISDVEAIMHFAELGVVFLLFIIGLELKPQRLWVMRKAVFGTGGGQVFATSLVFFAFALLLQFPWKTAFLIGIGLSMSSTAFALQMLSEKNQINTEYGRLSFSILLFQDIAVIPVMAMVPIIGAQSVEHASNGEVLNFFLLSTAAILGLIFGGRYLLRPIFRFVAQTRIKEIFTASSLLLVVGIAYLMNLIGLSMALGAFIAGVLLADSEYRHEIETDIDPFKGLLLGLFFMSVGMSVNFGLLFENPFMVLGVTLGIMVLKAIIIYFIGRISGLGNEAGKNISVTLLQVGEFAFVLFAVAHQSQLMDAPLVELLILVVSLSMALTPLFFNFNEIYIKKMSHSAPTEYDEVSVEEAPVIVAGLGRFGQIVLRLLRTYDIDVIALEHNSEQVDLLRKFGVTVYYGDATRLDLLKNAGAEKAKVFILAIDNVTDSIKTALLVRQHFPHLKIFARARNRQHAFELMDLGVEVIHRETLGSSLAMAEDLLVEFGFDKVNAKSIVHNFKQKDQEILQEQFLRRHDEKEMINYSKQAAQQLIQTMRQDQKTRS